MIKNPLKILVGCINIFLYATITAFFGILIIIAGFFVWIIPSHQWRHYTTLLVLKLPVLWTGSLNFILRVNAHNKIHIMGDAQILSTKKWYLLISNHLSWTDIIILGYAFNNKLPVIKFFMKKALLWSLPFAGLACWILGYPFMSKHSHKEIRKNPRLKYVDIENTKKACEKFMKYPTTVMNFVEGGRFTEEKRIRQNSPYQHLLKPSSAGIAIVLNALRDYISGFINVTLQYETDETITFWKFVCNDFKAINIYYEFIPPSDDLFGDYYKDREYRKRFQRWLNNLWQQKETLLS